MDVNDCGMRMEGKRKATNERGIGKIEGEKGRGERANQIVDNDQAPVKIIDQRKFMKQGIIRN